MIYFELFLAFLQIGLFSIGGGLAAMPLIQSQIVDTHGWLTMSQFTDLITIAEMTPGPIAINSATFVGTQVAGITGAVIASIGVVFPSCFIMSLLFHVYYKYKNVNTLQQILASLRPAVVALIASAALTILSLVVFGENSISIPNINWIGLILFILSFIALRKSKLNPVIIMFLCGIVNLLIYTVRK